MKTNSIIVIFLALIVILAVNPKMVNNIYNTILGRLFLISIVIFLSMKNITLGLLVALIIISGLNQFGSFVEGMETMPTSTTVGEEIAFVVSLIILFASFSSALICFCVVSKIFDSTIASYILIPFT